MNKPRTTIAKLLVLAAAAACAGCGTSQEPEHFQPATATLPATNQVPDADPAKNSMASGLTLYTNRYNQTNPHMGSRDNCLAAGVKDNALMFFNCDHSVGPERGAYDAGMEGVNAASSLGYTAAAIKGAFGSSGSQTTLQPTPTTEVFQDTTTIVGKLGGGASLTVKPAFGD